MLTEYIAEALKRAHYEIINDPDEPYYGEVPELRACGQMHRPWRHAART